MLNTFWAVVRNGKIEPLEDVDIIEGIKVLVTLPPLENDSQFWVKSSQISLDTIWDNTEDDIYEQLLQK
ncbi:MAG: hypothetical protein ACUZ8E_16650 [Candidatus Anammoxibacter sp.]